MSDTRAAKLGIANHLCQGLSAWSNRVLDFANIYQDAPFGSSIRVSAIKVNAAAMEFDLIPNHQLQESMISVQELQRLWAFADTVMPQSIPPEELRLVWQLQKSITLVTLSSNAEKLIIFKSRTKSLSALYHELKILLTIPTHPNIIERPVFVVTTFSPAHQEHRVCGFLLRYYRAGALQDALPRKMEQGSLLMHDQVRWAKELTTGLMHMQSSGQFYSDLKMDNILLAFDGKKQVVILADFEQGRNFYNFAAPEVYYIEWIAELGNADMARSNSIDAVTKGKFAGILQQWLTSKGQISIPTQGFKYDNPEHGWYFPWLFSSEKERESSTVYSLGRVLWCIFEGRGNADNTLGRSIPYESSQRFPEFRQTPESLKGLIKRCTAGAREWKDGPISIFRRDGTVYPLGETGVDGKPRASLEDTKEAVRKFWTREMEKAVAFLEAKEAFDRNGGTDEQLQLLDYLKRPTLKEVLVELEDYSIPAP